MNKDHALESASLSTLSDDALLDRLSALVRQSRRVESELVAHIGEVDARKLYAREATASMFAYCTEVLHLSEYASYKRIQVARATRKHPELLAMLGDGHLHLSAITLIAPHLDALDAAGRRRLLESATHKSKRQVERLVAALAPQPDVPATIRKLPERPADALRTPAAQCRAAAGVPGQLAPGPVGTDSPRTVGAPTRSEAVTWSGGHPPAAAAIRTGEAAPSGKTVPGAATPPRVHAGPAMLPDGSVPGPGTSGNEAAATATTTPALMISSAKPAVTVKPLSVARYKVTFTASAGLRDRLERLQALHPGRDLTEILEEAVAEKLAREEVRRFGKTAAPRKSLADTDMPSGSRYIPAAVRRVVYERDRGRCTFVGADGRRCRSRHGLEFHHDQPFALGGHRSPENIRLLCRTHNSYLAEATYGKAVLERCRRPALGVLSDPATPGPDRSG